MKDILLNQIRQFDPITILGKVKKIVGLIIEGYCPHTTLGTLCQIMPLDGGEPVEAEVVGFRDSLALLMPLGEMRGLGPGSKIRVFRSNAAAKTGEPLLGRVINAMGDFIDGQPTPQLNDEWPLYSLPPDPMQRKRITTPMDLGVRSINALLTCGEGQRIGVMAGSGVGKSVLLGTMAKHAKADVNVIALIGERGREVREFIERDLGPEGLARSIVVVATSDQPPLARMRGAFLATAIAEYFCAQDKNVLLLMDSVTRFAMAMREVGLAAGEPPTTKGYPPSVFAAFPKLLERAGSFKGSGSITGIYTVLAEGDDMNDPIADTARSILDGHIILSRDLAAKNHYPCIDILTSASRVMKDIVSPEHFRAQGKIREVLATYKEAEDLINIGAYSHGSNPRIDEAISKIEGVNAFLKQDIEEWFNFEASVSAMKEAAGL